MLLVLNWVDWMSGCVFFGWLFVDCGFDFSSIVWLVELLVWLNVRLLCGVLVVCLLCVD